MAKNILVLSLLEEMGDEDDLLLLTYQQRNKIDGIFSCRETEGAYKILIEQRLFGNESKFREYFRISREMFDTVLSYVDGVVFKLFQKIIQ